MKKRNWKMPDWMEKYRTYLDSFAGGNPVEDLVNDDGTNSNVFNNAPRALICVSVKSSVSLLERLKKDNLIK